MGPRRIHKLSLQNYRFMDQFLAEQWYIVQDEQGNVDSTDKVSIDIIWKSFHHFMYSNAYPMTFCNKILLGKLLHRAGVEKIKRGPRKHQRFFYFPIRPVPGSKTELIYQKAIEEEPPTSSPEQQHSIHSSELPGEQSNSDPLSIDKQTSSNVKLEENQQLKNLASIIDRIASGAYAISCKRENKSVRNNIDEFSVAGTSSNNQTPKQLPVRSSRSYRDTVLAATQKTEKRGPGRPRKGAPKCVIRKYSKNIIASPSSGGKNKAKKQKCTNSTEAILPIDKVHITPNTLTAPSYDAEPVDYSYSWNYNSMKHEYVLPDLVTHACEKFSDGINVSSSSYPYDHCQQKYIQSVGSENNLSYHTSTENNYGNQQCQGNLVYNSNYLGEVITSGRNPDSYGSSTQWGVGSSDAKPTYQTLANTSDISVNNGWFLPGDLTLQDALNYTDHFDPLFSPSATASHHDVECLPTTGNNWENVPYVPNFNGIDFPGGWGEASEVSNEPIDLSVA